MNENLVQASPLERLRNQGAGAAPRLWNPEAAGAWSLIFNPVFGSILILMNWQALKMPEKVRSTQLWLVMSVFVLIGAFFLPTSVLSLVTIGYLLIWYLSVAKPQAKYIKERWGQAYPRRSWLWPLLIAFGILFSFICLIVVLTMAQAVLSQ